MENITDFLSVGEVWSLGIVIHQQAPNDVDCWVFKILQYLDSKGGHIFLFTFWNIHCDVSRLGCFKSVNIWFTLRESNIAMENPSFEDVVPIQDGDVPLLCLFTGG